MEGLRKHLNGIGGGVTNDEINELEQAINELEAINTVVEQLRGQLVPKVKQMNMTMSRVKTSFAEKKKTLKGYYPQERWIEYGIPDKR